MQQLECNNQSFSRILFYYANNSPLFRKREEKQVKKRVTPEFGGY
jgi:hypothetical protein